MCETFVQHRSRRSGIVGLGFARKGFCCPECCVKIKWPAQNHHVFLRAAECKFMNDATPMLQSIERDSGSSEILLPLVYNELRRLAAAKMSREAAGHTLQPTALVHEAWIRLVNEGDRTWKNRAQFFVAAAEAMRRILIESARRKSRLKHGGGQHRLDLADVELAATTPDEKVLLIDDALRQFEVEHPERAHVVMLKYFAGLKNDEVAETLGIGERTVDRHWVCAKEWLYRKIRQSK